MSDFVISGNRVKAVTNSAGGSISMNAPTNFIPSYWESYPVGGGLSYGLISSTASLFDGIACNDGDLYF